MPSGDGGGGFREVDQQHRELYETVRVLSSIQHSSNRILLTDRKNSFFFRLRTAISSRLSALGSSQPCTHTHTHTTHLIWQLTARRDCCSNPGPSLSRNSCSLSFSLHFPIFYGRRRVFVPSKKKPKKERGGTWEGFFICCCRLWMWMCPYFICGMAHGTQ